MATATPQGTKRKHSDEDDSFNAITFPYPNHKANTLLTVFDQAFYVHSIMLKLHSAFFRKFLDSPDKEVIGGGVGSALTTMIVGTGDVDRSLRISGSASTIRYSWTAKVDSDGSGWFLVSDCPKNQPYDLEKYIGKPSIARNSCHKFLLAIYGHPYHFATPNELIRMANMADYYCALPAVSRSLDSALLKSPKVHTFIEKNTILLAKVAFKLRNALLFRECMVWLVGPHSNPIYLKLSETDEVESKIRDLADSLHQEHNERFYECMNFCLGNAYVFLHSSIDGWDSTKEDQDEGDFETDYLPRLSKVNPRAYPDWMNWGLQTMLETKYRDIAWRMDHRIAPPTPYADLKELREFMYKNNLKLCPPELRATAGSSGHDDYFFCAFVTDEELPWGLCETEW